MINNGSMFKHDTAFKNMSAQSSTFNRKAYQKGIRKIRMAKASMIKLPRNKTSVKFSLAHSVCPNLCSICLSDRTKFCSEVVNWSMRVPYSEFSPCTIQHPYVETFCIIINL